MKKKIVVIVSVIVVLLIVLGIASYFYFKPKDIPQDKLNITDSYSYRKFGFIKVDDLWITKVRDGYDTDKYYFISLHFGPKDVENLTFNGSVDDFLPIKRVYVVFDPAQTDGFINLAITEFSIHMVKTYRAFQYDTLNLTVACTEDDGKACGDYPIMTCNDANSTDKVVYIKKANVPPSVDINQNCATVTGVGYDLIAGADNLLYRLFGVIDTDIVR